MMQSLHWNILSSLSRTDLMSFIIVTPVTRGLSLLMSDYRVTPFVEIYYYNSQA